MNDMHILVAIKKGLVESPKFHTEENGYYVVSTNGGYMLKLAGVTGFLACVYNKELAQVICDKLNEKTSKPTDE